MADIELENKLSPIPEAKSVGGRPPAYDNPDLMQQAIDLFFQACNVNKQYPTITRLAYALGFESRQSFYDYEVKPEFTYIIKRARLLVESSYEDALRYNNPTGSIFALKNMGWKDKTETAITTPEGIQMNFIKSGKDYEPPVNAEGS